eukprot:3596352-Amphidinium_carterae.1
MRDRFSLGHRTCSAATKVAPYEKDYSRWMHISVERRYHLQQGKFEHAMCQHVQHISREAQSTKEWPEGQHTKF